VIALVHVFQFLNRVIQINFLPTPLAYQLALLLGPRQKIFFVEHEFLFNKWMAYSPDFFWYLLLNCAGLMIKIYKVLTDLQSL